MSGNFLARRVVYVRGTIGRSRTIRTGRFLQFETSLMTTPPIVSGPAAGPKSLVARFIGVLTSPRDTFGSVVAHPKWFGMLAVTTLIVALFSALPLTTEAGRQA